MSRLRILALTAVAGLIALTGCRDGAPPTSPDAADVRADRGRRAVPAPTCDVTVTPAPGTSIQAAVDAATSGDRICVESGTYREQVVVDKSLTLRGFDDPVIEAPDDPDAFSIVESTNSTWEPIVFAYGGTA